jgi:hypothetical protein
MEIHPHFISNLKLMIQKQLWFLMKTLLFSTLFLFAYSSAIGQKPHLRLYAGAGTWRDWLTYFDAYRNEYQHWQPQLGLGVGVDARLSRYLSFAPEGGLEYFQMRHYYTNSHFDEVVYSDLGFFSGRISLGIVAHPTKAFSVRVAISTLVSALTIGQYDIVRHLGSWNYDTLRYANNFSRIRNPVIAGPEMSIGYDFIQSKHGQFGMRISSFIGVKSVFLETFPTILNPRIFKLRADLVYTLPTKDRTP